MPASVYFWIGRKIIFIIWFSADTFSKPGRYHHPIPNISTRKNLLTQNKHIASFFTDIRNKIGILFTRRNYSSLFMIGLLNGLLPCGLVYLAIAASAVATGDPLKSSMASFGLGTLPLMWAVLSSAHSSTHTRKMLNKAYPYMMGIMACLLIIRGLGLNIPYISPAHSNETSTVIECHN